MKKKTVIKKKKINQMIKGIGMKTGSPLLFAGESFFSSVIKTFDPSELDITHIETALDSADCSPVFCKTYQLEENTWYSFKSTKSSDVKDVFGNIVNGVHLTKLSDVIAAEKGVIFVRDLERSMNQDELNIMQKFMDKYYLTPYQEGILELGMSALDFTPFLHKADDSSLFCSEVSTELYRDLNWTRRKSNEQTPADYSRDFELTGSQAFLEVIQLTEVI